MLSELLFHHKNACPLRTQIQFWVHEAAGSNPASPTDELHDLGPGVGACRLVHGFVHEIWWQQTGRQPRDQVPERMTGVGITRRSPRGPALPHIRGLAAPRSTDHQDASRRPVRQKQSPVHRRPRSPQRPDREICHCECPAVSVRQKTQPASGPEPGFGWMSRANELSFLSFNRPRRPSSATQLSSASRWPNGRSRCGAAWGPNDAAGRGFCLSNLHWRRRLPRDGRTRQIGHQSWGTLTSKIPHRRSQARAEQSGLSRDSGSFGLSGRSGGP